MGIGNNLLHAFEIMFATHNAVDGTNVHQTIVLGKQGSTIHHQAFGFQCCQTLVHAFSLETNKFVRLGDGAIFQCLGCKLNRIVQGRYL